jgi:DNA-binding response OmpR family regulator
MAKIMIIEDNKVHNMLLCHNMEDIGHEPLPFKDVEPAREELERQTPDLFIIDMHIRDSKKSTLDFIKYLSKNKLYKHVPIIIISAYVTKDDIKKDLPKFNTDNVIEKPFNVETISSKVKELLKDKR